MDSLEFMKHQLVDVLNLSYSFEEWKDDNIPETYYIGEIEEVPDNAENGYEESIFMLTATSRGSRIALMEAKETIKKHFNHIYGLRGSTDSGSIAVFYEKAIPIPTGEADIKRLQINLKIQEWKKG